MSSTFNFNCPVTLSGTSADLHECGVEKTLTWSSSGVHTSGIPTI